MTFGELESFLESAGKKGFLTQSVLKQTITAIEKMKTVAQEDPDQPEVNLEIDGVVEGYFRRFMTIKAGELSPESATVYVNRVKKAIDNFTRYKQDPLSYKSNFNTGSSSEKAKIPKKLVRSPKVQNEKSDFPKADSTPQFNEYFVATFPLRKNFMLTMNMPKDLSTPEVQRLAFYLLSLCEDFNPTKPHVFYQDGNKGYSALEGGRPS